MDNLCRFLFVGFEFFTFLFVLCLSTFLILKHIFAQYAVMVRHKDGKENREKGKLLKNFRKSRRIAFRWLFWRLTKEDKVDLKL